MPILRARWLLPRPESPLEGGGVRVEGERVVALLAAGDLRSRRGDVVDLGDVVLAPGLVNAHAHLDLTALADRVPRTADFARWVRHVVDARAATGEEELEAGALRGADRLIETGTTRVGDIDSTGVGAKVLAAHPLKGVAYREVLDAYDPGRSAAAYRGVARPLEPADGRVEGLSPHAPFTVSPALLARLGRLARKRALPVAVHWSETPAEVEWLESGTGPLAELLGPAPRKSGLDLLEEAGLLGPSTVLIHGNLPRSGEPERLATAGASLAHCPGTHRFFDRPPAPLERYVEARVPLALGTDSRASNDDLDLRREMAALRAAHPGLAPERVWSMATAGGARAIGAPRAGVLAPGGPADIAAFAVAARTPEALFEELTAGVPPVAGVWIDGRRRIPPGKRGEGARS